MMTDIVDRLEATGGKGQGGPLKKEAADEIRKLRAMIAAAQLSPVGMQRKAAAAIRTFCRSLSPAAIQMSDGAERIYYAGVSVDALAAAVVLALSSAERPDACPQTQQDRQGESK